MYGRTICNVDFLLEYVVERSINICYSSISSLLVYVLSFDALKSIYSLSFKSKREYRVVSEILVTKGPFIVISKRCQHY